MNTPLRRRRPHDQPDPDAARAELEDVRRRRPDVERLVDALARERRLNNFTASAVIVFRGGKP